MKLYSILFEKEEESTVEPGMDAMASKLAQAIEKELESNKDALVTPAKDVNESAIIGILGYILLSNTVANMLSKMFKWLAKKYNKPGMMDNAE